MSKLQQYFKDNNSFFRDFQASYDFQEGFKKLPEKTRNRLINRFYGPGGSYLAGGKQFFNFVNQAYSGDMTPLLSGALSKSFREIGQVYFNIPEKIDTTPRSNFYQKILSKLPSQDDIDKANFASAKFSKTQQNRLAKMLSTEGQDSASKILTDLAERGPDGALRWIQGKTALSMQNIQSVSSSLKKGDTPVTDGVFKRYRGEQTEQRVLNNLANKKLGRAKHTNFIENNFKKKDRQKREKYLKKFQSTESVPITSEVTKNTDINNVSNEQSTKFNQTKNKTQNDGQIKKINIINPEENIKHLDASEDIKKDTGVIEKSNNVEKVVNISGNVTDDVPNKVEKVIDTSSDDKVGITNTSNNKVEKVIDTSSDKVKTVASGSTETFNAPEDNVGRIQIKDRGRRKNAGNGGTAPRLTRKIIQPKKSTAKEFKRKMPMTYEEALASTVTDYGLQPANVQEEVKKRKVLGTWSVPNTIRNPNGNVADATAEVAEAGEKIKGGGKFGKYGKYGAIGLAGLGVSGGLVLALSDNRGHQSNAQLYGQQPLY